MFAHAAKLGWEGIVSKNPPRRTVPTANEGWIKVKTAKRGAFPVVGFIKDPTGVAALYLGRYEGGDLVYMGKVGTGWSRTVSSRIRKQLDAAVTAKSSLANPPQETEGDVGRALVLRRRRIPRHHI